MYISHTIVWHPYFVARDRERRRDRDRDRDRDKDRGDRGDRGDRDRERERDKERDRDRDRDREGERIKEEPNGEYPQYDNENQMDDNNMEMVDWGKLLIFTVSNLNRSHSYLSTEENLKIVVYLDRKTPQR